MPAFTRKWLPDGGWSLAKFTTALLCAWIWAVTGARSGCDMASLKKSSTHSINFTQGWGCTAYEGGRNKLCGNKKGTRPWKAYFVCLCPKGKHVRVPEDFEYTLDEHGNPPGRPKYYTYCPLAAIELKSRMPVEGKWRLFTKWTKGYWHNGSKDP